MNRIIVAAGLILLVLLSACLGATPPMRGGDPHHEAQRQVDPRPLNVSVTAPQGLDPLAGPVAPTAAREISLDSTALLFAYLAVEWERVAEALPAGFEPAGYPHVPVGGVYQGAPEGALGSILVAVFEYSGARVDGMALPGGRLAVAWLVAQVPSGYAEYYPANAWDAAFVWLGAVSADALLVDAFEDWRVPAERGTVTIAADPSGLLQHTATVQGATLGFTLRVMHPVRGPLGLLGGGGPPAPLVQFSVVGATPSAVNTLQVAEHSALLGPAAFDGTLGPLDEVVSFGAFAQYDWFGDSVLPPGGAAENRFTFVAPLVS